MAAILTFSSSLSDRLTNRGRPSMGLGADAPSACARHRCGWWPRSRRRTLGRLQAGLLPAGAGALATVPPPFPRTTPTGSSQRPAAVLRRVRRTAPTRGHSRNGWRRCAKWNGSSMPSARLPGRRRCSPICPATPIAWRSPTSACWPSTNAASPSAGRITAPPGKTRYKTMTLGCRRVHPPLPVARPARRLSPHSPLRIARQCRTPRASRPRARTAARRPRRRIAVDRGRAVAIVQPTFVCPHCGAAMIIVEIFARGATDSCTARLASCSMSTGIGCFGTSALRRQSPKADGFAFRCRSVASRPRRHPRIRSRTFTTQHLRNDTFWSVDPIPTSDRTANHRIAIAA